MSLEGKGPTVTATEWWAMPEHQEFVNDLLEQAPDAWDFDEAAESIVVHYVRHLEAEVQRLGGCRRPHCRWADGEPCDHGYLSNPMPAVAITVTLHDEPRDDDGFGAGYRRGYEEGRRSR